MKPNKICKRSFIMAMALVAVFALAAAWPRTAVAAGPAECSLIGTWYGDGGYALRWLGIQTAGSSSTKGEMEMNWVRISEWLLKVQVTDDTGTHYLYPNATILTGGRGVWEQTSKGQYKYTWYAYGLGLTEYFNSPIYSVRVSGLARNTAEYLKETLNPCDSILIDFTYEVFDKFVLPQQMSDAVPVVTLTSEDLGAALEMRVPLVERPVTP